MLRNYKYRHLSKQKQIFKKTQKLNPAPRDNFTAYDTRSIMHYDGTLGGRFESNPIMKDKRTGKSIGVNREMSSIDIQKLNEMYPCKAMEPVGGKLMNSQ